MRAQLTLSAPARALLGCAYAVLLILGFGAIALAIVVISLSVWKFWL